MGEGLGYIRRNGRSLHTVQCGLALAQRDDPSGSHRHIGSPAIRHHLLVRVELLFALGRESRSVRFLLGTPSLLEINDLLKTA